MLGLLPEIQTLPSYRLCAFVEKTQMLAVSNQLSATMAYVLLSPSQLISKSQCEGKTISKSTGQDLTSSNYMQTNSTKSETSQ